MRKEVEYQAQKVDLTTGELGVAEIKNFVIRSNTPEQFYMTYLEFMAPIFKIKSPTDMKVLAHMCLMMGYNSAKIDLSTKKRRELCEEVNIMNSALSRSLSSLTALGLISGGEGQYEVNPFVFWRGSSKERKKFIQREGIELRIKFKIEEPQQFVMPVSNEQ